MSEIKGGHTGRNNFHRLRIVPPCLLIDTWLRRPQRIEIFDSKKVKPSKLFSQLKERLVLFHHRMILHKKSLNHNTF